MKTRPTLPAATWWLMATGLLTGCMNGHDSAGPGTDLRRGSTGTGGVNTCMTAGGTSVVSAAAGGTTAYSSAGRGGTASAKTSRTVAANGGSVAIAGTTAGTDTASGGSSEAAGVLRDYLEDPNFPDSFWQSASLASLGIDGARFEGAVDHIQRSGWEIHSFLVAYRGKLVLERYGMNTGTNPNVPGEAPHQTLPSERQPVFSTTKSFTSTLVGIAIDETLIPNVGVKVASYFPDYEALSPSAVKSSITIEDLLTMRSGLEFMEGEDALFQQPDPARALFSRPVMRDVGVDWYYDSGNTQILMEILRVATGQSPLEYASTRLFAPLGIRDIDWKIAANGNLLGGFGLSLTGREMARFGELFRKNGVWANQQVVSKGWVDTATAAHCDSDGAGNSCFQHCPTSEYRIARRAAVVWICAPVEQVSASA